MVNIAGRSKGCSTCRQRRVKCDETRPICQKCQRLGLECDGPKGTTFVPATIVKSRRRGERASSSSTNSPPEQDAAPGPSTALTRVEPNSIDSTQLIPGQPEEYHIMFARKHLDPEGPVDTALQELLLSANFSTLSLSSPQPTPDISRTHLTTVRSFATVLFGTFHNCPHTTRLGLVAHGQTLQQLSTALSRPKAWESDSVLVAITTLAIQEAIAPSAPGNYLQHMLGINRLLGLRDPVVFNAEKSVALYKCLRHMMVFASLRTRTESVFARPAWRALLRDASVGSEERTQNDLYEVLTECSGVIARCDRLKQQQQQQSRIESEDDTEEMPALEEETNEIRRQATELRTQLHTWRVQWDSDPQNTPTSIPSLTSTPDPFDEFTHEPASSSELYIDTSDITFANPISPLLLLLYDITLLHVLQVLISLPSLSQGAGEQDLEAARRDALVELCRCIPAQISPSSQDVHASPVVHWAMQISGEMLKGDESEWAGTLRGILESKGSEVIAKGLKE